MVSFILNVPSAFKLMMESPTLSLSIQESVRVIAPLDNFIVLDQLTSTFPVIIAEFELVFCSVAHEEHTMLDTINRHNSLIFIVFVLSKDNILNEWLHLRYVEQQIKHIISPNIISDKLINLYHPLFLLKSSKYRSNSTSVKTSTSRGLLPSLGPTMPKASN